MADTKNGGKIERGKVISVANGLYTVASFDRDGIEVAGIPAVDGSQYEVGETVHFVSFPDGTGWIACGQDATAPASGSVTGVKGNAESAYRTGKVNLTPANIGALALTGGTLTGNLVIGVTTDTVARNLTVRNSLGSVALAVGTDGAHGLYSNTKGGFILYVNKDDNVTNNRLYIPRPVSVIGNLIATTGIGVNKTAQQEAKAGFWANSAGNLYLTGDTNTGSFIYFYFNKAVSATSYIREEAANQLYTNAYFAAKDYSGSVRRVITSYAADGNRIAGMGCDTQKLYVSGQHGTTGTTYSSKNVVLSTSDIRLKEHIEDTDIEALPIVNRMRVRKFDWKDGRADRHQVIGVVADELEMIDKHLAVGGGYDKTGLLNMKSVDTFYLVGYLLKAIQELSAELKKLKGDAA